MLQIKLLEYTFVLNKEHSNKPILSSGSLDKDENCINELSTATGAGEAI